MSIDSRFLDKILNNLMRATDTKELDKFGFEITDEDRAKWTVEQINKWLDEGRLVRIENNRLEFGSIEEINAQSEQFYNKMSVLVPQLLKNGREYITKRRKELGIKKRCLI